LWQVFRAEQTLLSVCVLAEVGLRRGELTGLRSDDLHGAELSVERAVKRAGVGVVVGPTKTYRCGRATVSPSTSRLWREYLTRWFGPAAVSGVESFWMFSRRPAASKPFSPETLARRFGRVAQRTSAAGPVSLHRVRHTTATVLVAAGDMDGAQHRLRHSRLDTTLRHYVDTTGLTDDVDVAEELQRLYGTGAAPISTKPVL
jgi:integrase